MIKKSFLMNQKESLSNSILSVTVLTVVIVAVTIFSVYQKFWIGPIFIVLGFIHLHILRFFGRSVKTVWPDVVFGTIDNGILVIAAIIGADFAGILGAIIGGAAANAITDGYAGIFEGWTAQYLRKHKIKEERTAVSSSIAKMAGCFFGAGVVMVVLWTILRL